MKINGLIFVLSFLISTISFAGPFDIDGKYLLDTVWRQSDKGCMKSLYVFHEFHKLTFSILTRNMRGSGYRMNPDYRFLGLNSNDVREEECVVTNNSRQPVCREFINRNNLQKNGTTVEFNHIKFYVENHRYYFERELDLSFSEHGYLSFIEKEPNFVRECYYMHEDMIVYQ